MWILAFKKQVNFYLLEINLSTLRNEILNGRTSKNYNPDAKLGNDVTILNNVLIGMEKRGKRTGSPDIGNKVYIASGAVITGKIKVGNNVLIAANSFVNFDVPNNSIVIGNKIIKSNKATDYYI